MSLPWTEKYRPETLSEVQGNNSDIRELKAWARSWTPGDTPQLITGEPGVGKTATVQALANDMDWELVELNASSARTTDDVADIADRMASGRVDGGTKCVFLDEVDSFHHSVDLSPLSEQLSSPSCPVLCVANEDWKVPNAISRRCTEREFSLQKRSIKAKLRDIAEAEGINLDSSDLGKLATRGNLRAAIQDLQRYGHSEVDWDERSDEDTSFEAVEKALKGKQLYYTELNPEELVIWLDENLSNDYQGIEAGIAYDALSRADKYLGRFNTGADSYNRYWKYAGELAQMVGTLRTQEPYGGYIQKGYPEWFRHSTPNSDGDSPEGKLYQALGGEDLTEHHFSGGFGEFRRVIIPILRSLPRGIRLRLALEKGLDGSELEALGLSEAEFTEWVAEEGERSYDDRKQQSLGEW